MGSTLLCQDCCKGQQDICYTLPKSEGGGEVCASLTLHYSGAHNDCNAHCIN